MKELTKRQKQIVDASLEIIASKGMQNLTIKNLAGRVHVTEGAIYRHFKSKSDILISIAEFFKSSSTEILNSILDTDRPGIDKIKSFFLNRLEQFTKNRGLVTVMFSDDLFKDYAALQKQINETIHVHKLLIIQSLIEEQKIHKVRKDIDPEHLFITIMGSLRLLVTRWRISHFKFDLIKEGSELWNSIERLILQN